MTMKKIFLSILFIFVMNIGFSQVYKWRASYYSSRINPDKNTTWSEWNKSGVLIVAENQRVKIYSSTPQTYDMIEDVTKTYDKDDNPIYSVMCVDENGTKCKMVWYHTDADGSYVVFYFSNIELMYKVESLN